MSGTRAGCIIRNKFVNDQKTPRWDDDGRDGIREMSRHEGKHTAILIIFWFSRKSPLFSGRGSREANANIGSLAVLKFLCGVDYNPNFVYLWHCTVVNDRGELGIRLTKIQYISRRPWTRNVYSIRWCFALFYVVQLLLYQNDL